MEGARVGPARRGRIVKMDNRDSDFILDLRFFNSLLGPPVSSRSRLAP